MPEVKNNETTLRYYYNQSYQIHIPLIVDFDERDDLCTEGNGRL